MASTTSLLHPHPTFSQPVYNSSSTTRPWARATARPPSASRRDCLIFTATTALTAVTLPSSTFAKDIPLFGLRKKIEKAEEQAEELVKESFETVEKGIENVEVGIEKVEQGIDTAEKVVVAAEKQLESAAESGSFNGLAQAGAVAGAEVLGVLIATSIVNGILGPEPKNS